MVYNVVCLHSSAHWINCEVFSLNDGCSCVVTFVYSLNTPLGYQDL